jgi:AcrR family transcriptional regulator
MMAVSETDDLHDLILSAAKELFSTQGYHGLSMRQIAESVGVSKAALYYHFKNKEQLFLAILDAYLDEMETMIDRIQAQEPTARGRIQRLVENILSQPLAQRSVIRLGSQEMAQLSPEAREAFNLAYDRKFITKIDEIMKEGMDRGELRRLNPSLATWSLLGMMYPYFYPAHLSHLHLPLGIVEQLLTIYLDGATNPEA